MKPQYTIVIYTVSGTSSEDSKMISSLVNNKGAEIMGFTTSSLAPDRYAILLKIKIN